MTQQKDAAPRWHDPRHGWVDGRQVEVPGKSAILRLFAPLSFPQFQFLEQVHSVTGLVKRRQLRRQISPQNLGHLLKNLPRLETLVTSHGEFSGSRGGPSGIEVCCRIAVLFNSLFVPTTLPDLASAIQHTISRRLKRVSVFEDFNDRLALALENDTESLIQVETGPAVCPLLATAFASKSYELEHLSLSYIVDAQQFLNVCQPSNT